MSTILNLPKLRSRANFVQLDQPGIWVSTNVNLKILADSLPVDDEQAFIDPDEPVRAVPDPWAQARSFGEALCDGDHTLHKRALRQWQGLLAIMALRQRHKGDYSLRAMEVPMTGGNSFVEIMTTLTPEVAIKGAGDLWRTPTLIMVSDPATDPNGVQEKPLAMTNPICLISPGRDTHRLKVPKVYWAQGDLTSPLDPEAGGSLAPAEMAMLQAWLMALKASLDSRPEPGDNIAQSISELLKQYAVELGNRMGSAPLKADIIPSIERRVDPLYRPLWNDPELEDAGPADQTSQTRIIMKDWLGQEGADSDFKARLQGMILVDPAIAEAVNADPNHLFVWGNHSLGELLKSKAKLTAVKKEASQSGYLVATADDLFTDRAVELGNGARIASHPAGLEKMILPLRPLALLLGGDLKDRVRGQTSSGNAAITLTIRLDDGSPDGQAVRITRHFTREPAEGEGRLIKSDDWAIYNAQIWPDFKSPAWPSYFSRFLFPTNLKSKMPRPAQALSASLIQEMIVRATDSGNAIRAIEECNDGKGLRLKDEGLYKSSERETGENGAMTEEVQFSSQPFDALLYKEGLGDSRKEAAAGLVLLGLRNIERPSSSTRVAVDFGTTNTVACFGDNKASPVTFANRMLLPVVLEDQKRQQFSMHAFRLHYSGFLPPDERKSPIPSVAIPKLPYKAEETLWAFRNLIYFHTSQPPAEGDEQDELKNFQEATRDAEFELKWSPHEKTREAATDFLTQFMIMTAAELVNNGYDPSTSEWRFSVPEAMKLNARNQFSDSLQSAAKTIGKDSDSDEFSVLLSEGLSAACYMLSSNLFVTGGLNIVLDVGGGTTDITIWDREKAVWKGSIFLAGGNFFTSLLCENREILDGIGLKSWAQSLDPKHSEGTPEAEERRKQLAEMLFSGRAAESGGQDLQKAMTDHWGNRLSAKLGEPLRHTAIAYLSGIAWYLGKVTRRLVDEGVISEERVRDPAFAVCGRGGGIFRRMHGNRKPDATTEVTRALGVFSASLGVDNSHPPRFSASPAPKLEVVRGMLTDNQQIDKRAESMEGLGTIMPNGMDVLFDDNHQMVADELIGTTPRDADVEQVDMKQFREFLEALEAAAGLDIDLLADSREGALSKIADDVRTRLNKLRKSHEDPKAKLQPRQSMEPAFLIALRALVDQMAAPLEERDDVMVVTGEE